MSLWLAETTASTSGRNLNGENEKQMKIIIIVLRLAILLLFISMSPELRLMIFTPSSGVFNSFLKHETNKC